MKDGPLALRKAQRRVIFRADASVRIGTGHVMRCLTLGDALRAGGAEVLFLCRPLAGDLRGLIAARGHRVLALPALAERPPQAVGKGPAEWLGISEAGDAADCLRLLAGAEPAAWLVADHYAIGRDWQSRMRQACRRVMVLDDLADREHDCDLLLDPGLGRSTAEYAALLPPGAVPLLGPDYALLRPEFAAHRAASLARRAKPELRRILVTLGGADIDNATSAVLDALEGSRVPAGVEITVVMGASAPWLDAVRARAGQMRFPVRVLAGVGTIAEVMTASDLAIGAAGGTAWERCCLGLPSIQMVMAPNQAGIGQALAAAGAAVSVASAREAAGALDALIASGGLLPWLAATAARAAAIVPGDGVANVLACLERIDA